MITDLTKKNKVVDLDKVIIYEAEYDGLKCSHKLLDRIQEKNCNLCLYNSPKLKLSICPDWGDNVRYNCAFFAQRERKNEE